MGIQTIRVGDPAQAAGCEAGEAVGDAMTIAEFLGAVLKEADKSPVDIAEAEEAEVVGTDNGVLESSEVNVLDVKVARFQRFNVSKPRRRKL
jgi:hypothetical protein